MLKALIKKTIQGEGFKGRIDLTIVDDKTIRELNRKFRRKNKPTDVLSFSYGAEKILGDIIISAETTRRNARRFGATYPAELKRLVIHGALHLLGYDHGRKMSRAEKIYAQF